MKIGMASSAWLFAGLMAATSSQAAFWLRDELSVYNNVNPNVQAHQINQNTGEESIAGRLSLAAAVQGNGYDGATSNVSLEISSNYGSLSAQASGASTNSDLSGASSGVAADNGDPVASYNDQLTLNSGVFPVGFVVTMQITQALSGFAFYSPTAMLGNETASASISTSLQIDDVTSNQYDQTLTIESNEQGDIAEQQMVSFLARIGDHIELTGMLYANAEASTNDISPTETADFEVDGTAATAVNVVLALASSSTSPTLPADDPTLAGYVADSGTLYPTELPDPGQEAIGIIAAYFISIQHRRDKPAG